MESSRSALLGGHGGRGIDDMGSSGWGTALTDEEAEQTRPFSVPQLRQQQYQILERKKVSKNSKVLLAFRGIVGRWD